MSDTEFALWLTPREPLRQQLRAEIERLATKFDAVDFDPHVTVFCGPADEAEACSAANRVAKQFEPIELIAEKLDYTNHFTKTLFVQFQNSTLLRKMYETVKKYYAQPSNYELNPHLSLLYQHMIEGRQRELCRKLDIPLGIYLLDTFRVVETENPINRPEPIRRWRTVCEGTLGKHV